MPETNEPTMSEFREPFNRGNCYFQLEKYEEAIEDYNRALKINRKYKEASNNRKLAEQKLKAAGR